MSADGELPGMWEESDLSGGWADSDGMSARERLLGDLISLGQERCVGQVERDQCRADAERLVDAFAHELAEKQRRLTRKVCVNDRDGDGDCAACARNPEAPCRQYSREDQAIRLAADEIDPAKESDRG